MPRPLARCSSPHGPTGSVRWSSADEASRPRMVGTNRAAKLRSLGCPAWRITGPHTRRQYHRAQVAPGSRTLRPLGLREKGEARPRLGPGIRRTPRAEPSQGFLRCEAGRSKPHRPSRSARSAPRFDLNVGILSGQVSRDPAACTAVPDEVRVEERRRHRLRQFVLSVERE